MDVQTVAHPENRVLNNKKEQKNLISTTTCMYLKHNGYISNTADKSKEASLKRQRTIPSLEHSGKGSITEVKQKMVDLQSVRIRTQGHTYLGDG